MRFLLLISLGIVCLARAFPEVDDEKKDQLPEEDKLLILSLAERGSTMIVVSMMAPEKVMMDVFHSILETKKADQHVLDYMQNRVYNNSSEVDFSKPFPDYWNDLLNMFAIYSEPENLEKRNRFNLWTNGEFDKLMAKYDQTLNDVQKSFIEAAKSAISKLSETTKNSNKDLIEKFNGAVEEEDIMGAAMSLFGKLSYKAKIFRSASSFHVFQPFRTLYKKLY